MASESSDPGFLSDSAYRELQGYYRENPIALYTGAGVSFSSVYDPQRQPCKKLKYGLPGWEGLLHDILSAAPTAEARWLQEFEADVKTGCRNSPWEMADWVVGRLGKEEFKKCVVKVIQRLDNFPEPRESRRQSEPDPQKSKKHKQLGGPFLDAAPTLNAVCAFCAQLTAVVEGARRNTYRVSPNPRVRAVVTTNYDPFLEAASSTMFIRHRLKPVGARGSSAGGLHQIPVFHVHGYVPYPERGQGGQRREIVPMVDPVVTTGDYEKAWQQNNAFCFTMGPQVHVLRHYRTLFVGFSFRDARVNQLLTALKGEREVYDRPFSHYALMKRSEIEAKGIGFFNERGVKPIALDCYSQIPECLGWLYREGLKTDRGPGDILLQLVPKTGTGNAADATEADTAEAKPVEAQPGPHRDERPRLSPEQYWEELRACRNCYVKHIR